MRGPRDQAPRRSRVGTREVSLLAGEAGAKPLDLPQFDGGDPRPFEVVGIPLTSPATTSSRSNRSGSASRCSTSRRRCSCAPACWSPTSACTSSSGARTASSGSRRSTAAAGRRRRVAVNDCRGKPMWSGTTDAQGLARAAHALEPTRERCARERPLRHRPRPTRRRAIDLALRLQQLAEGHRALALQRADRPRRRARPRAATVLDRSLLRAGETVR